MELNIFTTDDGENVINKTLNNKLTIQINLKRDVDISSPSIILLDSDGVNYSDFNYAQIVELSRFYFITNVQRLNNKMIQIDLQCDVLETYKSNILKSKANLYRKIKDGDYNLTGVEFSELKKIDKYLSDKSLSDKPSIIVTTVGG